MNNIQIKSKSEKIFLIVFLISGIFLLSVTSALTNSSGEQRTIAMLVNFNNINTTCSISQVQDILFTDPASSVDLFYRESSYNLTWFTGNAVGDYTIDYPQDMTNNCSYIEWANAADNIAIVNGVDLNQYTRRVYVMPSACALGGWGEFQRINYTRSWIFGYCGDRGIYAHELGHNLNMHHASTATNEYGDSSDVMGPFSRFNQMNSPHKDQMGWIPPSKYLSPNESGIYDIAPTEFNPAKTTLPQALKFRKDNTTYYYFSQRAPLGFDWNLSSNYIEKLNIHTYRGSDAYRTYFIRSLNDSETYTDTLVGINITQINHTSERITVRVVFFPPEECRTNIPTLSITSNKSVMPGTELSYNFSIRNNDSPACGLTLFYFNLSIPAGWNGSIYRQKNGIYPGNTSSSIVLVTSPITAADGNYTFTVQSSGSSINHSASINGTYILDTTPLDTIPPTAPQNLAATSIGNRNRPKIRLTWGASSDNIGVVRYFVYRNNANIAILNSNLTTYTDSAVSRGNTYSYYIRAQDEAGNISPSSNTATILV